MKTNLLEPFGMTTSGYIWNETFAARAARPHDATGRPEDNRKRNFGVTLWPQGIERE
jgi:CubicO group peptidase (beta-lactamase class C family)